MHSQTLPLEKLKTANGTGIYDSHHPPAMEIVDKCVHCGFCLPTCPTYMLWHKEMDSPRGRIYLMKMAAEGGVAQMNETFVSHFDSCLGCMACNSSCPSGVDYGRLVEATRAQIERNYRRPWRERLFRKMIFALFPHSERLRWLMLPLWIYQRSGVRWLLHKSGVFGMLPARLRSMETLLPELSLRKLFARTPNHVPAKGRARMRVGVLLGCVQRVLLNDVNQATIRVLAAHGCEVVIPEEQGCCGALAAHAGLEPEALASARRLIEVFERAQVDVIAINSGGCGSAMKEYGHLLRDDAAFSERAKATAAKCRDISELLVELGVAQTAPRAMQVAYHDSCHLQHAQGIRSAPRQLLAAIPQLEVKELPEPAVCCGSAGIYNLVNPGPSQELAERKAGFVIESGAQALVSGNPGCLLQLAGALRRAGQPMPVMHVVELLDAAMQPGEKQP
jgi:glycolate oxidase iron-sulfur subunit